jgi:pSer/pThr/pTyr-binding forkhead associated (FHA) protein
MLPQLLALTDGPNIVLDRPIMLFGRHQECDIQLGSRKVSRRHCCVAQVEDYVVVRDLGSTNGIRINGVRVFEGNLKPGDELTIGNQRFQLQWSAKDLRAQPFKADHTGKAAAPAMPDAVDDDDDLESADLPVPLPEPGRGRAPHGSPSPALKLPDNVKLQPLSGEQPSPAK